MDFQFIGVVKMKYYDRIEPGRKTVVGVGSALIDILAHEDDAFLECAGAVKGGMTYVDKEAIDRTVKMATREPVIVPGGSACNTMVGIGQLGGQARFVGKCGNGRMGRLFRSGLAQRKVAPELFNSDSHTGRVLSIITPDAQRSMLTYLGASAEALPEEMAAAPLDDAAIVHIEGYLLFNRALMLSVLQAAKNAGARISLDLASFNVVEESRDILPDLIAQYVDILIANEDESFAYTGTRDETEALERLARNVDLAVLKLGARGSCIAHKEERLSVRPHGAVAVVDTTGAGDLWAAGFLFGLVNQFPLNLCGDLGSRCGSAVCQVIGADVPEAQWASIRKDVEEQWQKIGSSANNS
jgi:sugar/nucleoside kinase (ribokinase family)